MTGRTLPTIPPTPAVPLLTIGCWASVTRFVGREESAASGSGVDTSGRSTRFVPLKTREVGDEGPDEGGISSISTFISSVSILNRDLGGRVALCFLSGGWGSNICSVSTEGNSKGSSVSGEDARRRYERSAESDVSI